MIRSDLAGIPTYAPGKKHPGAIKLSSNEITQPPIAAAVAAMQDAAAHANRYPDMSVFELKQALATHLGVTVDQVTCGCGSSALCQQLIQATCTPGDEVIFAWRSFEAYPIFAHVTGATPVPVPLDEDHRHDFNAMIAAITDATRVIFVCNPNNPTGTTITRAEFADFMAAVPPHVVVALDEAYVEYVRTDDTPIATDEITRWPNLVGLRTFSKAYGLAGVRVGYAFGAPAIISAMEKCSLPFGVNAVAQAGAVASLADPDGEVIARTDITAHERERLAETIDSVVPSQANFVWIPHTKCPHGDPVGTAQRLIDAGVVVRAFPEGIRVTVTVPEETAAFVAAWDSMWDRVRDSK